MKPAKGSVRGTILVRADFESLTMGVPIVTSAAALPVETARGNGASRANGVGGTAGRAVSFSFWGILAGGSVALSASPEFATLEVLLPLSISNHPRVASWMRLASGEMPDSNAENS
jgi:hypothetical protein